MRFLVTFGTDLPKCHEEKLRGKPEKLPIVFLNFISLTNRALSHPTKSLYDGFEEIWLSVQFCIVRFPRFQKLYNQLNLNISSSRDHRSKGRSNCANISSNNNTF